MKNFIQLYLCLTMLLMSSWSFSQESKSFHPGVEVQWYPAGWTFMATGEYDIDEQWSVQGRIGYNLARRKDFSPYNDTENGGGFGGTIGARYYLTNKLKGFYTGFRTDWWGLTIDWTDASEVPSEGQTDITVFQPNIEIGYFLPVSNNMELGISFAGGWEINVKTEGEEVGQGRISLIGLMAKF